MQATEAYPQHNGAGGPSAGVGGPLRIQMVDLFCGCGGLSLGFELFEGAVEYRTVVALDNAPQAVRCYNANFSLGPGAGLPTARLCDLTWFSHRSEVLLYYLVHFSLWKPDPDLLHCLDAPDIGLRSFLAGLRCIDTEYEARSAELVAAQLYKDAVAEVEPKIFGLQICRAFLARLGLSSLRTAAVAPGALPWHEEYSLLTDPLPEQVGAPTTPPVGAIEAGLSKRWDAEVAKLDEASGKEGRGQHSVVAARLRTLVGFLRGEAGQHLKRVWLEWCSRRDSLRAVFCTVHEQRLTELYSGDRRIQLVLGGPPCKGFSRIGRAVIESLRDQGVHAWSSTEYGDQRNALLHRYVLFLEALRPDAFIFENVAHFASSLRTPAGKLDATMVLAQSIEELSSNNLHYEVGSCIVRAREHAVPQDRERFIMVGFNREGVREGAAREFFRLRRYETEVPLQLALQGLDEPGEFLFEGPVGCKTDHRTRAYTLIDASMPESHLQYIHWVRQPAPGSQGPPGYVDAHVVRRLRADDLALLRKFAPGQRWMDYKLVKSSTLADLRRVLEQVLEYAQANRCDGLPDVRFLTDLLGRVNGGLLLRLILEEVSPAGEAALLLDTGDGHHLLGTHYLEKGTDNHGDWFERLSAERPCKTIMAHIGKDTYGYFHPYSNRAISIREAARVQTFPDFFNFGSAGVVDGYAMIGNAVPPLLANEFAACFAAIYLGSEGVAELAGQPKPRRPARNGQLTMGIG